MLLLLGYILIGLFAGYTSKFIMPGKVPDKAFSLALLGMIGSIIGGLLVFMLFSYGRTHAYLYGFTYLYPTENSGVTLPAFWLSLFSAASGAVLILAVYKLIRGKWSDA